MASGFVEELKNLFKTKKQLNEEETAAIADAVEKEKGLVQKLKALEEEYNKSLKEEETPNFDEMFSPVTLERVVYDVKSDDELKEQADKEVDAKYITKISDINSETINKIAEAESKKSTADEKRTATLEEIDELFKSLSESAKNKALKQGVQRGSILSSKVNDIKDTTDTQKEYAEKSYQETLSEIDDEITLLENEKNEALSNLDLKKAVEKQSKLDTLQSQRDKLKSQEIAKNNAITKDEAEQNRKIEEEKAKYIKNYNANKLEAQEKIKENEAKNGYEGEKQQNYAERYNIALEFYLSLDPDISLKALEASANMKYYLGNYYDKLKEAIKSHSSTKTTKYI